jgi:hypothetical protein
MFTRQAKGVVYTGVDPTGRSGMIRVLVEEMTREQLAAWCLIDAATASQYVNLDALKDTVVDLPSIDNEPEKPLPKLPWDAAAKPKQGK